MFVRRWHSLVLALLSGIGCAASSGIEDSTGTDGSTAGASVGSTDADRATVAPSDDGPAETGRGSGSTTADTDPTGTTETGDRPEGLCAGPIPADYGYAIGESYFGRNEYIEYLPGDLPIVLTAPHGGDLEPEEIPPQEGVLAKDSGSLETTLLVRQYLLEETGRAPHVIINHLTRHRLNANRDKDEAAFGNVHAEQAWDEFHDYIEDAKTWVTSACGRGHYFDLHTNGHAEAWNEMGFALSGAELDLPDEELDTPERREKSTLRSLTAPPEVSLVEVLRGPTSLGGVLDAAGVKAVPSPSHPGPAGGGYFTGGYNVRRHGSRDGGVIDGTQIESHFSYINAGEAAREDYSQKLTHAMIVFMESHYAFDLEPVR